ncbi:hypothetical protein, partial [Agrobacterium cavarae]|uniref:hypothetical protein n=1 Tax=Agrobacterium cavarae TaxID=2528239 RepID=UPI0028ACA41C
MSAVSRRAPTASAAEKAWRHPPFLYDLTTADIWRRLYVTTTFARFLALFFFLATVLPACAEEFILS